MVGSLGMLLVWPWFFVLGVSNTTYTVYCGFGVMLFTFYLGNWSFKSLKYYVEIKLTTQRPFLAEDEWKSDQMTISLLLSNYTLTSFRFSSTCFESLDEPTKSKMFSERLFVQEKLDSLIFFQRYSCRWVFTCCRTVEQPNLFFSILLFTENIPISQLPLCFIPSFPWRSSKSRNLNRNILTRHQKYCECSLWVYFWPDSIKLPCLSTVLFWSLQLRMTEAEIIEEAEGPEAKRMKQGTLIIQLQVRSFLIIYQYEML